MRWWADKYGEGRRRTAEVRLERGKKIPLLLIEGKVDWSILGAISGQWEVAWILVYELMFVKSFARPKW